MDERFIGKIGCFISFCFVVHFLSCGNLQDSVIQLWSILRGEDPAEQCEPQLIAQASLKGDVAAMEVSSLPFK